MQIGHAIPLSPTVQGTREWLDQRRGGIGGSDVAAIMGARHPHMLSLSPWTDPHEVYASKVHGDEIEPSLAMRCGTALEQVAMAELSKQCGYDIITDCGGSYRHPDYDWLRFSPDGIVVDDAGNHIALAEGKTSGDYGWDSVPIYYQCQLQWGMLVFGLPRAYIGCVFGKNQYNWWIVEADSDFKDALLGAALDFWIDHIAAKVPPPADWSSRCIANLERFSPTSDNTKSKVLEPLSAEYDAMLNEMMQLKGEQSDAEKTRKERIKTLTALLMAEMSHKRMTGTRYKVTKRRSSLRRKGVQEEHPDVWADCMVTKPARPTFSVQELKAKYPDIAKQYTAETYVGLTVTEIK